MTAAVGLTEPERHLLPQLPRGTGLWKLGRRSHVVHHLLHHEEARVFDTDAAMREAASVNAADLAEKAALGSLMLQPEPDSSVWSWLRASDFAKPWHRDVYKVLRELHDAGRGTSVEDVAPALAHRLGVRRASLPRLHDLVQAVPPDPDAGEYARIVLDAGVRRELAQQAIVLKAGARAAAVQQSPHPLRVAVGSIAAVLDGAERRVRIARDGASATR